LGGGETNKGGREEGELGNGKPVFQKKVKDVKNSRTVIENRWPWV